MQIMLLLLGFSFLAGIFTALSPCILPVLPAILSTGVGGGRLRPLGTILGLICSFAFFTLTLSWLVHRAGVSPEILRYVAIALVFFFGLVMIFPGLSNWFAKVTAPLASLGQKIQGTRQRQGFGEGIVFGVALGLLWTPCAGPILGTITALAATESVNVTAVLMTVSYSIGSGAILLIYAYGSAKILSSSRFLSRYTERIRQGFGVLMVLFGLILTLHWDMVINEKLAQVFPEILSEKIFNLEEKLQKISHRKKLPEKSPAPELTGITAWINSRPLTLLGLRGKVVLIDFWTYSCINCIRTFPHLKNWYRDYKDYGFTIIGVHTPEFEFEKNFDNVKKAVVQFGITYPVAMDNNYATWKAYENSYWPAHYLIDQTGIIRMVHFGEGDYAEMEAAIRNLLNLPEIEIQESKKLGRPTTPETYLGLDRSRSYPKPLTPGKSINYSYEGSLDRGQVGLKGEWQAEGEYILATSDTSILDLRFLATHVFLVMGGSSSTPLEITLDGKPYGTIAVNGDREYQIVCTSYERHLLSLKVPKGIRAYVFTFGGE
jgi:cytochrome c biogenesis protein CcdA/thiol-disulfide isomerase/thioredoxin